MSLIATRPIVAAAINPSAVNWQAARERVRGLAGADGDEMLRELYTLANFVLAGDTAHPHRSVECVLTDADESCLALVHLVALAESMSEPLIPGVILRYA